MSLPTTPAEAKQLILAVLHAGMDGMVAELREQGCPAEYLDSTAEPLTLAEAEERTDTAIRAAYRAFTGEEVIGDPVEFINEGAEAAA